MVTIHTHSTSIALATRAKSQESGFHVSPHRSRTPLSNDWTRSHWSQFTYCCCTCCGPVRLGGWPAVAYTSKVRACTYSHNDVRQRLTERTQSHVHIWLCTQQIEMLQSIWTNNNNNRNESNRKERKIRVFLFLDALLFVHIGIR